MEFELMFETYKKFDLILFLKIIFLMEGHKQLEIYVDGIDRSESTI